MYDIIFHKNAERSMSKLPREIREQIFNSLNRIKILPHHFVKKLIGTPYFRLRVGDYRLILDIIQEKLIVIVVELGHRKNIYK